MSALAIIIFVIVYGRMIEIYCASRSAAFHPKAVCGHFGNPTWFAGVGGRTHTHKHAHIVCGVVSFFIADAISNLSERLPGELIFRSQESYCKKV